MIVGARPRLQQIILEIWKPLTSLFAWDVAVTIFHRYMPIKEPALPVALFGTAIALFLGFRTNAAYRTRWWRSWRWWPAPPKSALAEELDLQLESRFAP